MAISFSSKRRTFSASENSVMVGGVRSDEALPFRRYTAGVTLAALKWVAVRATLRLTTHLFAESENHADRGSNGVESVSAAVNPDVVHLWPHGPALGETQVHAAAGSERKAIG